MLTHFELFSGASGLLAGLRAAGVHTVAAVEIDPAAAATHRLNHPDVPVLETDVRAVAGTDLLRLVPGGPFREVGCLAAGIPCQTFSHAGPRSRASYDDRQTLFRDVIRLAIEVGAGLVLLECVPGILTKPLEPGQPALAVDELRRVLDAAGYTNRLEGVLDAADFGVPQRRKRWVCLAARDRSLSLRLPTPTTAGRPVIVREAFAGLPDEPGGDQYVGPDSDYSAVLRDAAFWRLPAAADPGRLTHHHSPGHRAATVARFSLLRPGRRVVGLLRRLDPDTVAALQGVRVLPLVGFNQRGCRLHSEKSGPTVTGHAGEELVHPHANRVITVREAARLCSFADAYQFVGRLVTANDSTELSMYRQIGNAVPPLLGYHLGLSIREVLR